MIEEGGFRGKRKPMIVGKNFRWLGGNERNKKRGYNEALPCSLFCHRGSEHWRPLKPLGVIYYEYTAKKTSLRGCKFVIFGLFRGHLESCGLSEGWEFPGRNSPQRTEAKSDARHATVAISGPRWKLFPNEKFLQFLYTIYTPLAETPRYHTSVI